jgi:hypothetical protein
MEALKDSWTPISKTPQEPKFTFPNADIEKGISLLIYGFKAYKWTRFNKKHSRRFYLEPIKLKSLLWISPDKDTYTSTVDLASIKIISYGQQSKFFEKKHMDKGDLAKCLSISYKESISDMAVLNLEFENANDLKDWSKGLEYFIIRCSRSFSKNLMDDESLKELWVTNMKTAKDIKSLLNDMNINTTDDILQYHGSQLDKNNERKISLDEFKMLLGSLTNMDCINTIIKKYQDIGEFISLRNLQKFFEEIQCEKKDTKSCINDITAFSNYTLADYEDINKVHKTHSVCLVEDISKHHDRVLVMRKKYDEIINSTVSIERPKGLNAVAFSKLICSPSNCALPFQRPVFNENSSQTDYICKAVAYPYYDRLKSI